MKKEEDEKTPMLPSKRSRSFAEEELRRQVASDAALLDAAQRVAEKLRDEVKRKASLDAALRSIALDSVNPGVPMEDVRWFASEKVRALALLKGLNAILVENNVVEKESGRALDDMLVEIFHKFVMTVSD